MASVYTQVILLSLCIIVAVSSNLEAEKVKLEAYITEKKLTINPRYRLRYHVQPTVGWMNDPNGFSYFKGEYHLMYQYYPYDPIQITPMYWGHSSSPDMVNWKDLPTALIPEEEQCFSGSGVVVNDTLVLMYTAHLAIDTEPKYNETQYLAFSMDGVNFTKYEGNPVLQAAPNGSPDFRDPKVWRHGNDWYVVLGSKNDDKKGRVLLYKSPDLKNWEYLSIIGESNGTMGYMWECPDFFELDGKFILLMSPQGMEPQGDRYKNQFQTGYIIGSFNYSTNEFKPEVDFQEIDFGHDFYATQTLEKDGKRIMVAWLGMWDVPHPEAADGWSGAMTLSRELHLVGNRIIQKPVEAITSLRELPQTGKELASNQGLEFEKTAEIIVSANLNEKIELLMEGTNGGGKIWIRWDPAIKKVVLDRGSDDIRQVEWSPIGSHMWRIFLDASSLELFCGDGEVVFSSRVYPGGNWKFTNLSPQTIKVDAYRLKTSVPLYIPSSAVRGYPLLGVVFTVIVPLISYKSYFRNP